MDELTDCQFMRFEGVPRKVRIISSLAGGLCAVTPETEYEQRVTINSDGRAWFSAYNYGGGFGKYIRTRSETRKIGKDAAARLLYAIAEYFGSKYIYYDFAPDASTWELEITNTEGTVYEFCGSRIKDRDRDALSDMVREALGMEELHVFGCGRPDRVDRVAVDYHRVTKVRPKQPVSGTVEYLTYDYAERLVLDRESGTIEHIRNIGGDCVVSVRYRDSEGVKSLLDDIDIYYLFGEIEGNPDDVAENPFEANDYTITVDFKRRARRVISGTYDKKALPEFWGRFAGAVLRFMRSYGCGEILDPAFYGKVRRRSNEYVYCSVKFEGSGKSYYYIADEDNFSVGDRVIVPAGKENRRSAAEVVKVEYFAEDDVPLPLDRTKHIIRKCTDEDLDSPVTDDE